VSNDGVIKNQPLVLSIETATRAGGVAVARGDAVLASMAGDAAVSHSTNLLEMIDETLRQAGVTLADVDLFAVAQGPGSFTGLRIGLATAKAFAAHLHRQVIGVATLAALTHASKLAGNIVALLPAGRGEVFAQRFIVREESLTALDDPQHLSPRDALDKYDAVEALSFAGEGVLMVKELISEREKSYSIIPDVPMLAPSIAVLGWREYREGKSIAPENLTAVYVRASDAEINERWQQQKLQRQAAK
jgi:tRNA threonylcarbamoyladenosine biosynthesis protein TsaB